MNWDQIESKWALMTRRIRADFGDGPVETMEVSAPTLNHSDPVAPSIADGQAFAATESEFKTSAK